MSQVVSKQSEKALAERLLPVAGTSARIEARWLIEAAAGDAKTLEAMVQRRLTHEPVDRVIGSRGFWTLDLLVTPAVLSPRADSETLIRVALEHIQPQTVLDLGTGSGALLLAVLAECPMATGVGVDLSAEALVVARANAERCGLAARARFVEGGFAPAKGARFDLVISNPPYIPSADLAGLDAEVRDHDPHLALDGGTDGLVAYREIMPLLPDLLTPGGIVVLEIGMGQAQDVVALGRAAGLMLIEVRKDYGSIERAVVMKQKQPSP